MRGPLGSTIDPGVFWISLGISMLFVLWGVLFTDNLATVASAVLGWLIASFGWVFIFASFGFLAFVIFLAFSRYGKVRLGRDNAEPERAAPQQASSLEREPGR
jgi:glycine betaine transporter